MKIIKSEVALIWEWKTRRSKFGMELPFPNAMPVLRVQSPVISRTVRGSLNFCQSVHIAS